MANEIEKENVEQEVAPAVTNIAPKGVESKDGELSNTDADKVAGGFYVLL